MLFLLLVCNYYKIFAQNSAYFEHISSGNGLSQNDVNCIYQDHQGFMWFGTHDGLNKYDGYDFTIYNLERNNPNSLTSNLIFTITSDDNGNLWIGTTGEGLNCFNQSLERFSHFKHESGNKKSLSNNQVSYVYRDSKNRLWVGTKDGLNLLDLTGFHNEEEVVFKRFALNDQENSTDYIANFIYTVFEDSKNNIWVGGAYGLYKLSERSDGSTYLRLVNQDVGMSSTSVRSIAEDGRGNLFVGTVSGLYKLNLNQPSGRVRFVNSAFCGSLLVDDNRLWVGTNSGLRLFDNAPNNDLPVLVEAYRYNPKNPFSLTKDIVKSLYKDRTGIIWVGTNGGGVNKLDPNRKQFVHVKKTSAEESLSYDKIRSMYEDSNGTLWIGTEGGGLNMLPKQKEGASEYSFIKFNSPSKPFDIIEIERNNKKLLLLGTEAFPGLFELDITDPLKVDAEGIIGIEEIRSSVFSLLEDRHKNLWIGTYDEGLHRWAYYQNSNSYKKDLLVNNRNNPYSISSNIIRDILQDSHGNIWFATSNGLSKLIPDEALNKDPKFEVYRKAPNDPNSISHNYILSLYESKDGTIWIGTFGGGLNKYIPGVNGEADKFLVYLDIDGLPNNVIKGILEDKDGNLWLSTNKGLSKFDPIEETFKNYDENDGLQSDEFQELACLKKSNGEMLFGGVNGFNAFFPENIIDNDIEAKPIITSFSISNKEIGVGEVVNRRVVLDKVISKTQELTLKYNENSFSFEFAALHFAAPNKNKFAYMLEGFDEDWVYTGAGKRFATYTNLSSGNYTLKVKASNNDGVWGTAPSQIKIRIKPPFWQTNFAFLLYSLFIIGLLLVYRRFTIIKTTKKHQLELEHMEKEKNDELNRMKLEFFTNISHEFRTPLTLIKGPLKYLRKNSRNLDEEAVQKQYTRMYKNTEYLLRLVNQLLDFRKLNQGKMKLVLRKSNLLGFVKEICEPFQFLAQKQDIVFNVYSKEETIASWFDHDALEKIMFNLLSNAFKFTGKRGKVEVDISIDDKDYAVIKVKDNGSGIAENRIASIFDRFHTENSTERKKQQGAGIGLSFTKNLVLLHQGTIDVKSEPHVETVFTVQLPMNKEAYADIPEIVIKTADDVDFLVRSSESEIAAISFNDELIDQDFSNRKSSSPVLLVVDDNDEIRSFIKDALSGDYEVFEADNGKMGLELANKLKPSIILTDVLMPVMDGYELCKTLKTQIDTSHIPVIMLTAKSSQESEIQGAKVGADDYIRKPFDIELLELKLSNIVKQRNDLRKRFNREINLQPKEVTVTTMDEKFLQKAINIVEENMMNPDFNVEMLVKEMGHSRSGMFVKFKEITGLSPSEFVRNIKLKRAVQLFEQSDYSVKEIMFMTGFNTASYFSKCFKKQFGVVPSEYVGKNSQKSVPDLKEDLKEE
ncbi:two-component regulator propeller domain-containing protein [Seonamhaeicola sp.]|uniref:hybrid sensor histidine kinase/response regulator transcription factor n=1 Tax=Seonamhaeicola sp. TaxID=1912245 RepID=UPI0026372656|nr:two-component regulator propeller domain-containing protein [Seonamhaeicola sp.]